MHQWHHSAMFCSNQAPSCSFCLEPRMAVWIPGTCLWEELSTVWTLTQGSQCCVYSSVIFQATLYPMGAVALSAPGSVRTAAGRSWVGGGCLTSVGCYSNESWQMGARLNFPLKCSVFVFMVVPDAFPAASLGFCGACVVKLEDKPLISIPSSTQSAVDVVSMETKGTSFSLAAQDNHGMCMDMKFTEIDSKPYLLIAYEDGLMALWDLKTQAMVSELQAHSDSVMCFDYSNALNRGVSGSVDEKLCVWSISPDTTLTRVKDFNITNPGVNCMKFRPDSKIVATGGWDGHVRIFSGKKQTPLAVLAYHKASILSVAFAADNTLAVGSKDATISIWNVYR